MKPLREKRQHIAHDVVRALMLVIIGWAKGHARNRLHMVEDIVVHAKIGIAALNVLRIIGR